MAKESVKPYTSKDKWIVSIISGLLFLLIASPFLYQLTNIVFSPLGFIMASKEGCPTILGLVVHSLVFLLIVRLMMR